MLTEVSGQPDDSDERKTPSEIPENFIAGIGTSIPDEEKFTHPEGPTGRRDLWFSEGCNLAHEFRQCGLPSVYRNDDAYGDALVILHPQSLRSSG